MISVLIPSRTEEYLQQLFQSMELSEAASTRRAIVGDNGISSAFRDKWSGVAFVDVQTPFVFAKAINICAEAAPPENDLLVLNDDTTVQTPHWITMMEQFLASDAAKDYGLISLMIAGGVGNEDQLVAAAIGPQDVRESKRTICFVAGLIPRAVWTKVGGLDERFTGYGFDDDDYCKRLRDAGFKCGVTGAATVTHGAAGYVHSSSYARLLGQAEWDRQYQLNGRIFQAKWGLAAIGNRICLNLGCGDKPRPSEGLDAWINIDMLDRPGVIGRDLRRGIPFNNGMFDHVLADNVLEHFDNDDFIFVLNEIDRVLKVGGTVEIIVPHAHSQGSIQDPTHKMLFVPRSALYWNNMGGPPWGTPYGGKFVGITANLVATDVEQFGDEKTEFFIRFKLKKFPLPEAQPA
jgi:SAM-dependent methyltransferase